MTGLEATQTVKQMIQQIVDFISKSNESMELSIGLWDDDEPPYTMYAVISDTGASRYGHILYGESSYGAEDFETALQDLIREIENNDDF